MPEGLKLRGDTGETTEIVRHTKKLDRETPLKLKGERVMLRHRFGMMLKMPLMDADGGGGAGGAGESKGGGEPKPDGQEAGGTQAFDYEKLASIIQGKQTVTEDTVLKNYFKQQGLSQEEATQAISAFKAKKQAETPDIDALKQQATTAQQTALAAQIERDSFLLCGELGVDLKTMPYIIKMADTKEVITDGKIDSEKLKVALNKVLEDVPQLKGQPGNENGFRFGAPAGGKGGTQGTDEQLKAAFGL